MKFKLRKQQTQFVGAEEQFTAYIGGIGTGKTTALIAKALFHSWESPGNLGVIVRKNFTDLRTSTIKDFTEYTGIKVNEQNHEAKLPNGSTILFIHGDVLESLKNINAGFIGIEQADDFGDSSAWDMLIQRLRRQVKFRTGFLIANANGHNWVYDKFVKPMLDGKHRPNHLCVQATTYDFKDILPPDYIPNLEANLPARMFKRFVMNSHEIAEGRVYDEYDEEKHVVEPFEIPETWEKGFCLDHGFRNPTAVIWYAIDYDGNLIFYDEYYQTEKPISHHAEQIKTGKLCNGIADPSIFSKTQSKGLSVYSIADEYREYGVNLSPATKEVEIAAIARVNEFFKSGKVKIFRTLTSLRHECANWKWKPIKPGNDPKNITEEPEDYANHGADCVKYVIQTRYANSVKPVPKPERYSLAYYDEQEKFRKAEEERMNGGYKAW